MVLPLNLLIVQYTTWVFVPLDTFLSLLWVAAANTALFKDLLHINAARRFGEMN